MKKMIFRTALTAVLVMLSASTYAGEPVKYLDDNGQEKYGDEYGIREDGSEKGWDLEINEIVGYNSSLPYDHPTNQDALSNTLGLGWSDYVFPFITSSTINCFSLHQK